METKLLLALDVGNTHSVLGYFKEGELKRSWRISTHPICTTDEFKLKLEMILSSANLRSDQIEAIVVSSVVPAFTRMIQSALGNSNRLMIIDHTWPFSFEIEASPPHSVGTDRLVNAEAVVREYGVPAIVVDSGTATTLCAISSGEGGKAKYLGGAILPGIELSMEALARKAAQLFTIELIPPQHAIGQNTQDALKSGILLGYASMVDGMVRRFKSELFNSQQFDFKQSKVADPELPVVATGGISFLMKGLTTELTHFDPDVTLKGIHYLYESIRQR